MYAGNEEHQGERQLGRRDFSNASRATKVDRSSTLCKWAAAQSCGDSQLGANVIDGLLYRPMPAAWKTRPFGRFGHFSLQSLPQRQMPRRHVSDQSDHRWFYRFWCHHSQSLCALLISTSLTPLTQVHSEIWIWQNIITLLCICWRNTSISI